MIDILAPPDLARMRRDRYDRLQQQLLAQDLDALVLLGGSNVEYATGARVPACDAGRAAIFRTVAVVAKDDPFPHVFAAYPDGVPEDVPADHLHPPLWPEIDAGPIGTFVRGRVGLDEYTGAMWRDLAGVEVVDASLVMSCVKITKTVDELRCIRTAQQVNERAMADVQPLLRPGVRTAELTGRFLRRVHELGATSNAIDPIWQAMPDRIANGPWTVHGDVAFPTAPLDRILRDVDVIWVDTGVTYCGYASDFGRTWLVGMDRRPTAQQADQFARWRAVVDAVLAMVKPGATGGDLTRAAKAALPAGHRKPWLDHFYLIHGVGTDSAEMPLIGTDLGPVFDDNLVLAPGMVLVLEPAIWDDGESGYRSEDIVAVTDDGWVALSDHTYEPFG